MLLCYSHPLAKSDGNSQGLRTHLMPFGKKIGCTSGVVSRDSKMRLRDWYKDRPVVSKELPSMTAFGPVSRFRERAGPFSTGC